MKADPEELNAEAVPGSTELQWQELRDWPHASGTPLRFQSKQALERGSISTAHPR